MYGGGCSRPPSSLSPSCHVIEARVFSLGPRLHAQSSTLQCYGEGGSQARLGRDIPQLYSEMHNCLCDLRPNTADQAICAHEASCGHSFQQVLSDERINRWYAGNVDDGNRRASLHDPLQQTFHHYLGARTIERADEWQGENPFPEFHYRGREFEQLLLLAGNNGFAALLGYLGRVEP